MKVEKYYDYFGWNIVNVGKLFHLYLHRISLKMLKWHLIYLIIVIEAVEGGQAVKRYLIKGDLYVRFSANV